MRVYLTIFFFLFLLLGSNCAYSQRLNIGPKGGLNVYSYSKSAPNTDKYLGYHIGFVLSDMSIFASKIIGVQFELNWNRKAYNPKYVNTTERVYNMLEFPLQGKIKVRERIYILLGVQLSFPLNTTDKIELDLYKISEYKSIDILTGIQYENPSGLFVGGRYHYGITRAIKWITTFESYNRELQLFIGYYLNKKNHE